MKLRTTTPASKSLLTRSVLIVATIIFAIAAPIQISQSVSADKYDDQIAALQQSISQYQAQANILNSQAATLQSALAQIANQKAAIQTQIDLSQAQYEQLVTQIADTEKKIKDSQDALGTTIANLYVDSSVSPLEIVASSKNISDFLDKQEYRNSVRDQLTAAITQIKDLRTKLTAQKNEVQKLLAEQKSAKDALVAKQNEQQSLLSKTNNDEASYQNLISSSQSQIAAAKATQAALNVRFNSNGGYTLIDSGSLGDYPWNSSNCPMWGYLSTGGSNGNGGDGYNYGCRQCASYVAWRIAKETGVYPQWGDAWTFTNSAINTFHSSDGPPQPGSIAVMDPRTAGQSYGHVAWVEGVSPDGRTITVSQYNYDYGQGYGMYSEMVLSASAFDHYVKIK